MQKDYCVPDALDISVLSTFFALESLRSQRKPDLFLFREELNFLILYLHKYLLLQHVNSYIAINKTLIANLKASRPSIYVNLELFRFNWVYPEKELDRVFKKNVSKSIRTQGFKLKGDD